MTESNRALPFFTIGHSTRQVVELADLLTAAEVGVLVDVRAVPRSRTNPQFNTDVLPAALASAAIDYEHIAALGGLRGSKTGVPPAVNAFWTNQSFHNYADYAMGEEFRGETVFHILGAGDVTRARLTPAATPGPEGTLVYPVRARSHLE